jgi:hypothetical protein
MWTAAIRTGVLAVLALGMGGASAAADPGGNARRVLDSRYQDLPRSMPAEMGGGGGGEISGGGTSGGGEGGGEAGNGGGGGGEMRGGGGGEGGGGGAGSTPRRKGRWTGHRGADGEPSGGGGGEISGGGGESTAGGPGALGTIFSWLIWGALGIGAIFLILFIIREIARRKKDVTLDAEETAAVEEEAPKEAELERPLDDAELLARAGKFAEAIHMLLLRTLEELARADGRPAEHLTSREILGTVRLRGHHAREALTELVAVVELTWFGDDVPSELDWQRCRTHYERFVAAYRAPASSDSGAKKEAA